jgi:hypothetical protein
LDDAELRRPDDRRRRRDRVFVHHLSSPLSIIIAVVVLMIPLTVLLWRLDPYRMRRRSALAGNGACRFSYFVTRIAAGRVSRGLPHALRRCGYQTFSLYPALGAFMSARSFQTTTGMQKFVDSAAMGAMASSRINSTLTRPRV